MTEAERIARATRAQAALDEFVGPTVAGIREEYTARIAEVARTELSPMLRAEKIGTLSVALRVVDAIESGLNEFIADGELARRDKLRAEKIEQMSDAQQRLLKISGGY